MFGISKRKRRKTYSVEYKNKAGEVILREFFSSSKPPEEVKDEIYERYEEGVTRGEYDGVLIIEHLTTAEFIKYKWQDLKRKLQGKLQRSKTK